MQVITAIRSLAVYSLCIAFASAFAFTACSATAQMTDKEVELFVRKPISATAFENVRRKLSQGHDAPEKKLTRMSFRLAETYIEPDSKTVEPFQVAETVVDEWQGDFVVLYTKTESPSRGLIHTRTLSYLGLIDVVARTAWAPSAPATSIPSIHSVETSEVEVTSGVPARPTADSTFVLRLTRSGAAIFGGGSKLQFDKKCEVGAPNRHEILGEVLPVVCTSWTVPLATRVSTSKYLFSKSYGWYFPRSIGLWTISKPFFSPHRIRHETNFDLTSVE